ncbi:MAG: YIP1 family protein, partial [Gammaproteobacteria bacterium]
AVRNLPWEPQPAPDLPPPPAIEASAASTAQGVQGSIRDVAPLGAAAEAPPSGGRPAPAGPRGPVGSGAPAP